VEIPYFKRGAWIDLTLENVRIEKPDDYLYREFLGGKGIGAILLLNHLQPHADPLSPDNKIIFLTGPLTASGFPSASRGVLVTKSPLTGTFLDSNIGGSFGKALKSTGLDFVVIQGAARHPVWIDIQNERISIKDATQFWGYSTSDTQSLLSKELGDDQAEIATIGLAGERLVLFASISCGGRMFGRGGSGAVMGSKNLKAIALRGSRDMPWFKKKSFREAAKKARDKILANPMTRKGGAFQKYGTTFTVEVTQAAGVLPTRNWQDGAFEKANHLFPEVFFERKTNSRTCFQCPIGCSRIVQTRGESSVQTKGPEYETIFAFGPNCGISDPDTIIKADLLCEEYGLDTISCGGVISFLMECTEKGLIDLPPGQGPLAFEDSEGLLSTIKDIGKRQGIGELLGKGVRRMSDEIAPESRHYAMCVKGLELPGYDPRGMKAMALLYATSDRGGCHLRGSSLRSELLGLPGSMDRLGYAGKANLVVNLQKTYTVMNVVSECLFAGFALTMDDYAEAIGSLFEVPLTADSLLATGKKIWDLTRLFNCQQGFSPEDDTLPERLFKDPILTGASKGEVVDRNAFSEMKKEYYQLQQWDAKTGIPHLSAGDRIPYKIPDA
jgi:aldehyde:ferredoxin oxidoreductase